MQRTMSGSWRASRVGAQSKQHCWRKKRQLVDEADVEGHQEAVKSIYQTRDHSGVSTELILRKQQNDNSRQDSNHLTRTTAAAATTTTSGAQMRPSARLIDNNDSAKTTDDKTRRRRTTIGCRRPVNTNLLGALVALLVLVNLANLIGLGQVSCSPQVFRSSSSSSTSANQQAAPSAAFGCPYPAVSPNSQVNIVSQAPAVPLVSTEYVADEYATLKADTQASYKCDHGFELLGQETLTCLQSGRWSGSPPSCVTNIALGKPTNQSSTVKGGDSRNANDGRLTTQHDSKHCTETRVDQSPWWQIDLLQVYEIRSIRLLGRACCNPQLSLHDIEIRVGNSSSLQGNRLCAWYPNNLDEGVARDFQCANPIYGRFVSIQMVGIESALSLCEVMVFSTKEFPPDRCNIQATLAPSSASTRQSTQTTTTTSATTTQQSSLSGSPDSQINVFNRTCYEMQATQGGSFLVADTYCKARGGSLVHSVTDLTHSYISQELERMKSKLKSKLVWLGAKRENASPNAQGPITPGSTSALIGSDSILHHSLVSDRGLSMSLNEFPVEGLFAPERSLISPGEPSPIFSPLKLARTSLLQVSSGAGGSTSRGSQTFGLPTSGQHHPTNRTIEHTGRSLSIIQPNQVASFLTPPVPIQTATDRPAFASLPTSQPSSPSSPISFSGSSHVHRSLRPPALVSSSSSSSSSSSGGSQRQEASAAAAAASTSWNTQIATAPSLSGGQSSSSSWRWTGDAASDSLMSPVTSFLWAEDQPNNYNNQQDCIVMDGAKKWLWNDVTCELDYLPWVCQYRPSTCGSPDRNENSTVLELPLVSSTQDNPSSSADPTFQLGKTITYACPVGHKLDGPRTRKCLYDGTWSGKAPRCQYINCGPVGSQTIDNGRVVYLNQSQTTYGSQVKYVCYEDYVLVGDDTRQCQGDGKWAGKQPFCAYKWCPVLQQISNGALNVSSYSENSIATYQCNSGYKLIGNDTRQCLLGGKWTNQEPFCQYVDCGQPKQIPNGSYQLLNGTNYLSVVEYTCNDNYTLVGNNNNNRMICSHNNRWTGKEPQCELIDCGQPVANAGSRYVGDSFSVHSTVDYKCDPGFKEVSGSGQRTCGRDGQWTGQPLSCKYVDCGRVPAILKGEVSYINGTTYLASQVTYDCTPGNRLSGHRVRFCGPDARWTGSSPKCEEVRCEAPSLPANGSAVYIGNDRSFKEQSFSVGVTVKYECDYGHVVKGSWSSRLCQANGEWSGEPPVCKFVDCGLPPTIDNGNFVLKHPPPGATIGSAVPVEMLASRRSDNAASSGSSAATTGGGAFTYYGTIAHYNCEPNFKLQGPGQRECLETGLWRTPLPTCEPVQCPRPEFFDEFTQVAMISRSVSQSLAEQISSSTSSGSSQSDHQELIALASKATKLIANNQWLVSQQESQMFGVGDKLYYSCVPGYELYGGPEIRTCTQYGQWSGSSTPRCRLIDCGRPSPIGQEGRFYLLNETTTFNSLVEYSCVRPFKLVEVKQRQAGNLIEILSNAQAGVTPILTSLPIGVKVCANNGQWMPNDQQPKCVSSADSAPNGGQFDGVDNTLDGSHRSVHVTSNTGIGSNHDGAGATADNNLEGSTGGFHNHQQAASTSLWAKVIIAFCLLIMLALIILTLICIRSGKKEPKQGGLNTQAQQVLHRSSMLTPPGHQAAAAVAAIQLQLANGKGMQQQQQQQHPASHHQGAQMMSGHQNIYLSSGMHKMFPGSMVGQSQMTSAALSGSVPVMNPYGDETGASPNLVLANGRSMAPIQQADMGAGNRQHSQSMMDNYSRLSIDSDQTSVANHHHHPANKTIRHNPNGLVTFVSPSQHQQQQQQTTRATSQHQVSPQSISTSLSVSSSSSPSSSSSAHHTTATRLSGTDSASSPSSGSANHNHLHHHQQHLPAHHLQHHHHHLMAGGHLGQESEYQAPQQFIQQEVSPSQPSPPSLPAHPPPPHRVQQHHKQLMKHQQHSKAAQMAAVAATTTSTSPHGANDQSD